MRMKSIALLVLLASGPACASCEAPADHVEQRQCLGAAADRLTREIHQAQHLVRAGIAAWDVEPGDKARSLKSTRQFQIYKARQCEFEASSAAGGNGAGDMQLACGIRLMSAYLKDLEAQAALFPSPHA